MPSFCSRQYANGPNWTDEKIHELTGETLQTISYIRKQLIAAAPASNGHADHPECVDYEYERNGTACVFMFVAPFENWRRVSVREHRTKWDTAEELERLVLRDFKAAKKVTIVCDNLNTHTKGLLYKRFPPD